MPSSPRRPSPRRQALERRSAAALAYLGSLPRWLPATGMALLLVTGLALPGLAGAVVLTVVVAVLGWLVLLSWPVLRPPARVLRVLVLGVLAAAALRQYGNGFH